MIDDKRMTELEKCLENATKPKTANKRRHTKHENRSESWRNSNTQKHETTIINAHHEIIFGFAWNFRLHYGAPISKSDSFFQTCGFRLTVEVLSALCLAHGFFRLEIFSIISHLEMISSNCLTAISQRSWFYVLLGDNETCAHHTCNLLLVFRLKYTRFTKNSVEEKTRIQQKTRAHARVCECPFLIHEKHWNTQPIK